MDGWRAGVGRQTGGTRLGLKTRNGTERRVCGKNAKKVLKKKYSGEEKDTDGRERVGRREEVIETQRRKERKEATKE